MSFSSVGTSAMRAAGRIGAAPIEIAVEAHHLVARRSSMGVITVPMYPL